MYFNKIAKDKNIINLYNEISKFEDETKGWAHHNYDHVKNVSLMMKTLLESLKYDKEFIDEAMVAGIMHDTGCLEGKDGHANRSYEFAKQYFLNNNIVLKNKELVLEAIKNHSAGFNTDNIIALTLILADKLDIKYTRVAKEGYKTPGMRQLQYIRDIDIEMKDNCFNVNFICDDKIDINELENFYFTGKVFKAIESFCKKINYIPNIMINDNAWKL